MRLPMSVRQSERAFLVRFKWGQLSAWPRIILSVRESADGAILQYQVRPFITPAVFVLPCLAFYALGNMRTVSAIMVAFIVVSYPVWWWYELGKLKRLDSLRQSLAHIGVQVCTKCGYDRFGLAQDARCPECGDQAGDASPDAI